MPWLFYNANKTKEAEELPLSAFLIPKQQAKKASPADIQKEIDARANAVIGRFKQLLANMKANPQRYSADNG